MAQDDQKIIEFVDLKDKILAALQKKLTDGILQLNGNFTLIDGFFFHSIQDNLPGVQIGGKGIPQIAMINTATGEIRYFALKVILPEIEI